MIHYKEQDIQGVYLIEPDEFRDLRGAFSETFKSEEFVQQTEAHPFVQENESLSLRGVFRGLHLQTGSTSQGKLVRCIEGVVVDVLVDLRPESKTFGEWRMYKLSQENRKQLYIPRYFAHGFVALSPVARFLYKVDNPYSPSTECCIHFQDPDLAIDWQSLENLTEQFILSEKDKEGISFKDYCARFLPSR